MTTPAPRHVEIEAERLRELYPGARIEIEPRWMVRAYRPIQTSNIGHELCVDARNLPDTPTDPPPSTEDA